MDRFASIDDVVICLAKSCSAPPDALRSPRLPDHSAPEPESPPRLLGPDGSRVGDSLPLLRLARQKANHKTNPRPLTRDELIFSIISFLLIRHSVSGHPMEHLREKLRARSASDSSRISRSFGEGNRSWEKPAVLVTIPPQVPQSAKGTVVSSADGRQSGSSQRDRSNKMVEKNISDVLRFSFFRPFVAVKGRGSSANGGVRNVLV